MEATGSVPFHGSLMDRGRERRGRHLPRLRNGTEPYFAFGFDLLAARGAGRVSADLDLREACRLRVEGEESADEGLAVPDYELQSFVRLKGTYDAREHAQDACLTSGRGQFGGRRFRIQTPVARTFERYEGRGHPLEPEDRAVDDWLA